MKYFKLAMSLPIFYYYLITNNFKKYDMAINPKESTIILCTPVVFFVAHVIFLLTIPLEYPFAPLSLLLFIPCFFVNFIITLMTQSKSRTLKFEKEQRRRRYEREQKEQREEEERRERHSTWEREWEEQQRQWEYQRQRRREQQEERYRRFKEEHDNFWRTREEGYYFKNFHNRVDQNRKNAMHLLDLQEPFTKQDVKSAYRKLVKVHHPDAGGLQANFVKLNKAYNYLMERM